MGFFESATFSTLDEAAPFWHQYIVTQSMQDYGAGFFSQ
jgi:hypothetical protein